MLIQLSQRANAQDAIPLLKQSLQEEESMAN
jgi:ferritin-like metal-binding protein YciE